MRLNWCIGAFYIVYHLFSIGKKSLGLLHCSFSATGVNTALACSNHRWREEWKADAKLLVLSNCIYAKWSLNFKNHMQYQVKAADHLHCLICVTVATTVNLTVIYYVLKDHKVSATLLHSLLRLQFDCPYIMYYGSGGRSGQPLIEVLVVQSPCPWATH